MSIKIPVFVAVLAMSSIPAGIAAADAASTIRTLMSTHSPTNIVSRDLQRVSPRTEMRSTDTRVLLRAMMEASDLSINAIRPPSRMPSLRAPDRSFSFAVIRPITGTCRVSVGRLLFSGASTRPCMTMNGETAFRLGTAFHSVERTTFGRQNLAMISVAQDPWRLRLPTWFH